MLVLKPDRLVPSMLNPDVVSSKYNCSVPVGYIKIKDNWNNLPAS